MPNNPLISILIVAYNPGEYLKNTLRSCIEQTYENTEILILDNNSSEDIYGLMIGWFDDLMVKMEGENYEITIPKTKNHLYPLEGGKPKTIKLYRSEENLGPYSGLNFILEKAQGKYIAIQDHDDIWHPEKLSRQVEFLESHAEYMGCGTKTIMYYEGDGKYFEYSLGERSYYTVHPSLLFRYDGIFRYDTRDTQYMCDAWSLKNNLCHGEKKIANLDESLTLHMIKEGSGNYSYRWHKLNWMNIRRVYSLHSPLYATLTLCWEVMRKIVYPILQSTGLGDKIDMIERLPFRMLGNKIKTTQGDEWWKKYIS